MILPKFISLKPAIHFKRVDLPIPLAPINEMISPFFCLKEILSKINLVSYFF